MAFTNVAATGEAASLRRLSTQVTLVNVVSVDRVHVTEIVMEVGSALIYINRSSSRSQERRCAVQGSVGCGNQSEQSFGNWLCAGLDCGPGGIVEHRSGEREPLAMAETFIAQEEVGLSL